jgi:hypothetical protein
METVHQNLESNVVNNEIMIASYTLANKLQQGVSKLNELSFKFYI